MSKSAVRVMILTIDSFGKAHPGYCRQEKMLGHFLTEELLCVVRLRSEGFKPD